MKTNFRILPGLAAALLFCTAASAVQDPASGPTAEPPKAVAPAPAAQTNEPTDADTNSSAEFSEGRGLRFNFRDVPLEQVLSYLSKAAGFVIHPQVNISGRVNAWSEQPMTKEEALGVLGHVLGDSGYTLIRDGRVLTIVSSAEARRKDIPIVRYEGVDKIPRNNEAATYIIPVRTLNPVALMNNLRPLMAPDVDLQANESANSLLVTGAQSDIRRIADILAHLDSVSSSINTIEVLPLKYGDAKALASLVKELFPSQGSSGSSQNGGANARFGGGGRGGRGGGGGGNPFAGGFPGLDVFATGGGDNGSGQTPGSRIAAVADDHSNSLIVSAPEDLIPTIRELVQKLDQPVDDVTQVKVFRFKHADPVEMANVLASLFPDQTESSDTTGTRFQFGGPGGAAFGMMAGGATAGGGDAGQSVYMKKLGKVAAVADPRTQSLLVSTSRQLMPQVEDIVNELDQIDANAMRIRVFTLKNAEAADVQEVLQALYSTASSSTSQTSQQNNLLQSRAQTMGNNMMSSGVGSGMSTTSSSSGSSTGRGGQ